MLLDEPTAALGVAETARVEATIKSLKARNLAIFIISHRLDQVLAAGNLLFTGTPAGVGPLGRCDICRVDAEGVGSVATTIC